MAKCATKRVIYKDNPKLGPVTINEADYDPALHVREKVKVVKPRARRKVAKKKKRSR